MQLKKHLVTASYVSDSISQLDSAAKSAGITILCEMGLDPGIGMDVKWPVCMPEWFLVPKIFDAFYLFHSLVAIWVSSSMSILVRW